MPRWIMQALTAVTLVLALAVGPAVAQQQTEPRFAFVVGNAAYAGRPLQTALNDAGLVAEALRSIGFDVTDGADLGQADFTKNFREFLAKAEAAGPEALVFVYFSGYGLQYDGENFLLSAEARLARDSDIEQEGVRLSDLVRPLADAPGRAKIVVVDAARPLPFQTPGRRSALGLGAVDSPPGMLIAFANSPGAVVEEGAGPYGPYATAIAEMVRNPGLDVDAIFVRIRARAHQISEGQQTPWHVSALGANVVLVPGDAQADVSAPPPPPRIASGPKPMREAGPEEAYSLAIEQDALPAYVEFVSAYPRHPYAPRVWAIIRARREALAWLRAVQLNTPPAYWTYLRRYPNGIYAPDAELRLRRLSAPFAPPPSFAPVEFFDVPPPLADEPVTFVARLPPAPRPPVILIAPPPPFFVRLPPPPPRQVGVRVLPVPVVIPVVPKLAPVRPAVAPVVVRPAVVAPPAVRPVAPVAPAVVRPGLAPFAPAPVAPKPAVVTPAPAAPKPALVTPAPAAPRPAVVTPPKPAVVQPAAPVRPAAPPVVRPQPVAPAAVARPPAPAVAPKPVAPAAIAPKPAPVVAPRPVAPAVAPRPVAPAAVAPRPVAPAAVARPPAPAAVAPRPAAPPVAAPRPAAPPPRPAAPAAAAKKCQVVNGVQVCR